MPVTVMKMLAFCADNNLISPVFKSLSHDRLTVSVHSRRIEKVNTSVDGFMQQVNRL